MQVWRLRVDGHDHRVEAGTGVSRRVRWYVDDEFVGERAGALEDSLRLSSDHGELEVRFTGLGSPRRATLGDIDLVPDPGSSADRYEQRLREHPRRYAALATAGGVAKVVVPILLTLVAVRWALSFDLDLPLPDLPSIPAPDLPSVPLPSVPWPDWELPGWVREVLDKAKYVWPIVLAYVIARAEIRRRREQDEKRADSAGDRRDTPNGPQEG